jgi:hypothetical protein
MSWPFLFSWHDARIMIIYYLNMWHYVGEIPYIFSYPLMYLQLLWGWAIIRFEQLQWTHPSGTLMSHAYCWTWCWGSDSHQFFWHTTLGSPQIAHNNSTSIWEPSISLTHGLGNWFVWKSAVGYCKSANFLSQRVDTLSYCGRSQWLGLFVEILNSMLCVLVSQELAELNRQYEAKFGFVFLVCASGKSSAEILSILKACFHLILSKCCLVLFLSFLKLVSTCMRERQYLVLGKLVAVAFDSCS